MKRAILIILYALLTAGLALAQQPSAIARINLQVGKSVEGGIAVNPATHKAYVIAELATEGADDQKAVFVLDGNLLTLHNAPVFTTIYPPKAILIANENEYIVIDSTRNLIYVPTKFDTAEEETDTESDNDSGGEVETPDGVDLDGSATAAALRPGTVGTLTVIDGNTDKVIATYEFPEGVEPKGVAVDSANSIVYVGAKAPEGESAIDGTCSSGVPIPDIGEPADVECWTPGRIYVFLINPADATEPIKYVKAIPAGDDPESVVFENGMVYAANEDDGTVTIASAVVPDGNGGWSGGELQGINPTPVPPTHASFPYDLAVFYWFGPNLLACLENQFEADKMASGLGSVFVTDDRSRVAKITGTAVVGMWEIPGASACEYIPNTDGGGLNTANNIALMQKADLDGGGLLYVVSEQNTVAIFNPRTMQLKTTITIPEAQHLDGIAVDSAANRVWLTDEVLQAVFVLQGSCASGTGRCTAK